MACGRALLLFSVLYVGLVSGFRTKFAEATVDSDANAEAIASRTAGVGDPICAKWKAEEDAKEQKAKGTGLRITCYDSKQALLDDHTWCKPEAGSSIPHNLQGLFWMKDNPAGEREVAFCASVGSFDGDTLTTVPAHSFVFEDSAGGKKLFDKLYHDSALGWTSTYDPVVYRIQFRNEANTVVTSEAAAGSGSMSYAVRTLGGLGNWWFVQRDTKGNVWDRYINMGVAGEAMYQPVRLYRLNEDGSEDHEGLDDSVRQEYRASDKYITEVTKGLNGVTQANVTNMLQYVSNYHRDNGYAIRKPTKAVGLAMVHSCDPSCEQGETTKESFKLSDVQKFFLSDFPQPVPERDGKDKFVPRFFRVAPPIGGKA